MATIEDFGEHQAKRQAELEAQWERVRREVGMQQVLADAMTEMVRAGSSFEEIATILRATADKIDLMIAPGMH